MVYLKTLLTCFLVLLVTLTFAEEAYFAFTDYTGEEFIFKLTDPAKIDHARRILNGEERDAIHVMGRVKKAAREYNSRWSFHFDPDTIQFFIQAIEICDASALYTEDHLDEACGAFLPGCFWCPWSSRLTREVVPGSYSYNKIYNINQFILDHQVKHPCSDNLNDLIR